MGTLRGAEDCTIDLHAAMLREVPRLGPAQHGRVRGISSVAFEEERVQLHHLEHSPNFDSARCSCTRFPIPSEAPKCFD